MKLQNPWIQNKAIAQEKLYAQLCCVAYLLDVISPNNGFKQKLKVLLSEVPAFTSTRTAIPERFFG